MPEGKCLCGAIAVTLARAPDYINICNCDFCRKLGAAWGYYAPGEVRVTGTLGHYVRDDIANVWLTAHFCPRCGTTTHYTPLPDRPQDSMAVNMRIFAQSDLTGIAVRYLDGRAVDADDVAFERTGDGHIGDGKAF